ncbi:MAG: TIGR04211 family SH3 domain-containing protein [Desulfamplus sp.]|nr:TIGR04211 family SH3 domain-containing protein [Desulfamplus sp.]MBF0411783.1 TIGR04211 family SH3 domain-containing protein [Desulfamplus sp.]
MKKTIKTYIYIKSRQFTNICSFTLKSIFALVLMFSLMPAVYSNAEQYYVGQRIEITMRTGPGTSYKVMTMLPSGEEATMMEYGKEWSRIRTSDGKDGWVLSRYLTKEMPATAMLTELQAKNSELSSMLEQIKAENSTLSGTKERLTVKEKEYSDLKKRSSNFLAIEEKYHEAVKQLEEQKVFIDKCNSQSHREILYSFSIGAGVLIIGIILGMSAKKKQKSSFL